MRKTSANEQLKKTSSKTALNDRTNRQGPTVQSSLNHISNQLKGVSPTNAATNMNNIFNKSLANQVTIHVCDDGKKKS